MNVPTQPEHFKLVAYVDAEKRVRKVDTVGVASLASIFRVLPRKGVQYVVADEKLQNFWVFTAFDFMHTDHENFYLGPDAIKFNNYNAAVAAAIMEVK